MAIGLVYSKVKGSKLDFEICFFFMIEWITTLTGAVSIKPAAVLLPQNRKKWTGYLVFFLISILKIYKNHSIEKQGQLP